MAGPYYVNDDGDNSDGLTWAKAYTTLANLIVQEAPFAADEIIYIGHTHEELIEVNTSFSFANGTETQPVRVISATVNSDSPVLYQAGANINTDGLGTDYVEIAGGSSSWYGVTFSPESDFRLNTIGMTYKFYNCIINAADSVIEGRVAGLGLEFHDCDFVSADAAGPFIVIDNENHILCRYCTFDFGSAGSGEEIISLGSSDNGSMITFEDSDFSACTSDMALFLMGAGTLRIDLSFQRCRLPSAYTVPAVPVGNIVKVGSCSGSSSTVPFLGIGEEGGAADAAGWLTAIGTVISRVAQYRTGGASDGENVYSWEMSPNANISYYAPLVSPPIVYWAEAGSQTVTIHFASGTNADTEQVWGTLSHPDTADPSFADHVLLTTRPAPLVTGNAITYGDGDGWNGADTGSTGDGNGRQKLVFGPFVPKEAGPVIIRVYVAYNEDVYVDPKPVVT